MQRFVHLSDMHFPIAEMARLAALEEAIGAEKPSLIVITGDLTRTGRRREFDAARDFVSRLPQPVFVVPGNHDVPVFQPGARLLRPFGRFDRYFPPAPVLSLPESGLVLARLDTARGYSHTSWDWSLGAVSEAALNRLALVLGTAPPGSLRMVACHHPLIADPADPYRSRTRGGLAALHRLASLDVAILLHGHLHRSSARLLPAGSRGVLSIGAGTLSVRERGAGAGFNTIAIEAGRVTVIEMLWQKSRFVPGPVVTHDLAREPIGSLRIDAGAG